MPHGITSDFLISFQHLPSSIQNSSFFSIHRKKCGDSWKTKWLFIIYINRIFYFYSQTLNYGLDTQFVLGHCACNYSNRVFVINFPVFGFSNFYFIESQVQLKSSSFAASSYPSAFWRVCFFIHRNFRFAFADGNAETVDGQKKIEMMFPFAAV